MSSFQKQEYPVNLELNVYVLSSLELSLSVYVLSSLELSYYALRWLVPEPCSDTGGISSSSRTIRLNNLHPTCATRMKNAPGRIQ